MPSLWQSVKARTQTRAAQVSKLTQSAHGGQTPMRLAFRGSVGFVPIPPVYIVAPAPAVVSVVASSYTVTITFNINIALVSPTPAAWTITAPAGLNVAPVSVLSVAVAGSVVTLTTSEQTGGAYYTLTLPGAFIFSTPGGGYFIGPYTLVFEGASSPTPISIQVIDGFTLRVTFSKPVLPAGALIVSNYVITSPSLAVFSVSQVSSQTYTLTTGQQSIGTGYTLTVSNVFDIYFNPI